MDIGFTFFLHCLIHAFIFATCRWSECSAVRCAATLSLRSPHAGRQHHCNLTFMKSCQASSRIYKHINGNLPQWLKLNYVSKKPGLLKPMAQAHQASKIAQKIRFLQEIVPCHIHVHAIYGSSPWLQFMDQAYCSSFVILQYCSTELRYCITVVLQYCPSTNTSMINMWHMP